MTTSNANTKHLSHTPIIRGKILNEQNSYFYRRESTFHTEACYMNFHDEHSVRREN